MRPEKPGPAESEDPGEAESGGATGEWTETGARVASDEPRGVEGMHREQSAAGGAAVEGEQSLGAGPATEAEPPAGTETSPDGGQGPTTAEYADGSDTAGEPQPSEAPVEHGWPAEAATPDRPPFPSPAATSTDVSPPAQANVPDRREADGRHVQADVAQTPGDWRLEPQRPAEVPERGPREATRQAVAPAHHDAMQNEFLAGLLHEMRTAAEQSRRSTMDALHAAAGAYVESIRARSLEAERELRQAEQDLAAISEWSKAEVARILRETDTRVAARQEELERHLRDQQSLVAQQVERVQARVRAYEQEIDAFFGRLSELDDPASLAAVAREMPEPPLLDHRTDSATVALSEPHNGEVHIGSDGHSSSEFPPARMAGGLVPSSELPATAPSSTGATPVKSATEIVVTGLVSVAAIASFKRHLARIPGVDGVSVSSGSDGEFVFRATHEPRVAVAEVVTTLPGFAVEVVETREGSVRVSARDPEADA
ncbi:MAG: hypothetical protein M3301_08465 [Chloroflexota bacterium]|nr:hypothetical protein [Chloroflexota bacterium]